MLWIKTVVHTTTAGIEPVSGILLLNGINGYEVCDSEDFNSFLENKEVYFDYIEDDLLKLKDCETTVTFYVPENSQGLETILGVKNALAGLKERDSENAFGTLAVDTDTRLEEEDWENNWKQYYKPMEIGERLLVIPEWEQENVRGQAKYAGKVPLILEPGLTFGTGAHPSTQMVMEVMEDVVKPGFHCLDLGSGSGILSIAALRLGAESAVGIDIDPKAEDIARENAAYNGFAAPAFTALTGNVTEDTALMDTLAAGRYDLVLVNIVADVIIGLAPVLPHFLDESSTLICSGILDTRLSDVLEALTAAGLTVTATKAKDDWRCVTAKRIL